MQKDEMKNAAFVLEISSLLSDSVIAQVWNKFESHDGRSLALNNIMVNFIIMVIEKVSPIESKKFNIEQVCASLNDYLSGKNLIYVKQDNNTNEINEITKEGLH